MDRYKVRGIGTLNDRLNDFERTFKWMYFIRHPDAPRVKVGVSGDMVTRLLSYQGAWGTALNPDEHNLILVPARLMWLMGAREAREIEQQILHHFRSHRLHGEWLALGPEVESLLALARAADEDVMEPQWQAVLSPFAEAIGWPTERFRFKRNEVGEMLLAFGDPSLGRARQFRRYNFSPSRGASPQV